MEDLWWMTGAAVNLTLLVLYLAIGTPILIGIVRGRQLGSNPLGLATGLIFITCGIGHGIHAEHTVLPALLAEPQIAAAARESVGAPLLIAWDLVTAGVAVWYFRLRSRLPFVWRGAALCDDLRTREAQAREIHDEVLAGLVRAREALRHGTTAQGAEQMRVALQGAQTVITQLLGKEGSEIALRPGHLRQVGAAAK